MLRSLPPEILDLIVDHLHNDRAALKACCAASKSWIPRTRVHLFGRVEFSTLRSPVEWWMKAFPDPSNSPAHHTRTLSIVGIRFTATAGTDAGPWIRAFNGVVHFRVDIFGWEQVSLVPFHGLPPTIRSLRLRCSSIPPSEVFDFVCSFPLLENLTLFAFGWTDRWSTPLTSPKLTGSLELCNTIEGIGPAVHQLLGLPNGLHFTKIVLVCVNIADFRSTTDLVSGCSDTLEYLDITKCHSGVFFSGPYYLIGTSSLHLDPPTTTSFDLSRATKLKELVFRCARPDAQWMAVALQTIKSKRLRQITINPYGTAFVLNATEEMIYREWEDLDRLLIQLWTSRSIRPKVVYEVRGEERSLGKYAPNLLPELTRGGLVDVVERLS